MSAEGDTPAEGAGEVRVTSAFPPRTAAVGGYLEPIRAGGTLLWREGEAGTEVVLIRRPAQLARSCQRSRRCWATRMCSPIRARSARSAGLISGAIAVAAERTTSVLFR